MLLDVLMEVGFAGTWLILVEQVRRKRQFGQRPLKPFCICILPSEGKKSTNIFFNLNHSNFLEGSKTCKRNIFRLKMSYQNGWNSVKIKKIYLSWHRRVPYNINRLKVKCFGFTLCCPFSNTHAHACIWTHFWLAIVTSVGPFFFFNLKGCIKIHRKATHKRELFYYQATCDLNSSIRLK